ncbi:helix-turn-helix domain-containing protein [Kribbella sp. NPDC026611]|uniref:helix-turn-helix domain-containing protein n=1 Tax=Kribbella sp. NPDC026611 TaxID=3154911 RepID=UPI0033DCE4BD
MGGREPDRTSRLPQASCWVRSRLRKARELFVESNDTLQTIAEGCGYRSAFYLSRGFSNHAGQSPSEDRRSNRV